MEHRKKKRRINRATCSLKAILVSIPWTEEWITSTSFKSDIRSKKRRFLCQLSIPYYSNAVWATPFYSLKVSFFSENTLNSGDRERFFKNYYTTISGHVLVDMFFSPFWLNVFSYPEQMSNLRSRFEMSIQYS